MNTKGRIIAMILCLAILFPLTGLAARHVTIAELREHPRTGALATNTETVEGEEQ